MVGMQAGVIKTDPGNKLDGVTMGAMAHPYKFLANVQ